MHRSSIICTHYWNVLIENLEFKRACSLNSTNKDVQVNITMSSNIYVLLSREENNRMENRLSANREAER